jgi:hypothetical protein
MVHRLLAADEIGTDSLYAVVTSCSQHERGQALQLYQTQTGHLCRPDGLADSSSPAVVKRMQTTVLIVE